MGNQTAHERLLTTDATNQSDEFNVMKTPPYCSFIIPAYNEERRIEASLHKARAYFAAQPYSSEILVVNDGSHDQTSSVVRTFPEVRLLEQPRNMGKGAAVRRGMMEAQGTYRIFSDADFSTPITETARMLERLESGVQVCIGSRGVNKSLVKRHQPWYREFLGNQFNVLIQALITPGITDTQCGFKGFSAAAAQEIFSRTKLDGFVFDVEALYIARKCGYTIEELPVEWYNDADSRVRFRHSLQILREVFLIKRLHSHW